MTSKFNSRWFFKYGRQTLLLFLSSLSFNPKFSIKIPNFPFYFSALCLVAMTVDRYLSIRAPITFYNTPDCRSRIRTSICFLYLLSFLVFIPSAWQKVLRPHWDPIEGNVYWTIHRNRELSSSIPFKIYLMCREVSSFVGCVSFLFFGILKEKSFYTCFSNHHLCFQLIARIGPILVLTILNIGMIRSLRRIKIRYNSRRLNSSTPRVREMDRTRISVLLLITSATFILCTLPASLLSFFVDYVGNSFGIQLFRAFANCLQVSQWVFLVGISRVLVLFYFSDFSSLKIRTELSNYGIKRLLGVKDIFWYHIYPQDQKFTFFFFNIQTSLIFQLSTQLLFVHNMFVWVSTRISKAHWML